MNLNKIYGFVLLVFFSFCVEAQTKIYVGATIHIGDGKTIENGVLAVLGDKIIHVGKDGDGTTFKDAIYVNVAGKHIYPGLIAPHCKIGLNEIDAARPTRDYAEVGNFNPNINSQIAFNADSKIIPTCRFNGVLYAQPTPTGAIIPGSSSVMALSGDNWEEATVAGNDGIHINWHEINGIATPAFYEEHKVFTAKLTGFFNDAKAYCRLLQVPEKNLKFESMREVLSGVKNIYIKVNTARGIRDAVSICGLYGLKPVIVGGAECTEVLPLLKEKDIAVMLMNIHRLPARGDEDINLAFKIPYILKSSGIRFCIGIEGSWEVRNLCFQAGTAAAWGLSNEEALTAITLSSAQILKVDRLIGSIEVNKMASFVVCEGNLLEMKENVMHYIIINGKEIPLNDMQQQLYQKYHKKYFGTEAK